MASTKVRNTGNGTYEVFVDGEYAGRVRKGPASKGYFNSWQSYGRSHSSHREAVAAVVASYNARKGSA